MNHNPPPRKPQSTPTRPQARPATPPPHRRPTAARGNGSGNGNGAPGLGQPIRRAQSHAPQTPKSAPTRPMPSRPLIHPARTKRRRRQHTVVLALLVLVVLFACMIIGLVAAELADSIGVLSDRNGDRNKDKNQDQNSAVTTTAASEGDDPAIGGSASSTTAPSSPSMVMTTVSKTKEDMASGKLLIVNPDHAYVFPTYASGLANIFDNRPYVTLGDGSKVRAYKVRNGNQSLDATALEALNRMLSAFYEQYKITDMLVTWGYRSLTDQQDLYNLYVADYPGYSDAQIKQILLSQVDTAGYSEHHLGTCVDLKLYTDSGVTYTLDDEPGFFAWLKQNCWRYGYILRYPAEKNDVTGITYDPYHFRYIEIPHAYYIMTNGLCLEEYLEQLRTTTSADGAHLTIAVDGGETYEVYYVKASGNTTDLPVPATLPYTVSGDNMGGFIVTVTVS